VDPAVTGRALRARRRRAARSLQVIVVERARRFELRSVAELRWGRTMPSEEAAEPVDVA
jgi:hypothetical protein